MPGCLKTREGIAADPRRFTPIRRRVFWLFVLHNVAFVGAAGRVGWGDRGTGPNKANSFFRIGNSLRLRGLADFWVTGFESPLCRIGQVCMVFGLRRLIAFAGVWVGVPYIPMIGGGPRYGAGLVGQTAEEREKSSVEGANGGWQDGLWLS